MRIAIVGSRNYKALWRIDSLIAAMNSDDIVVSGGAIGVDRYATKAAINRNLITEIYLPDYKTFGRRAPLLRNYTICNNSDQMWAFWNGKSRGTKHAIEYMRDHLKRSVHIVLDIEEDNPRQLKIPGC